MRIKECETIATIIEVFYAGGLRQFHLDGGCLTYIPAPVDTIVIGNAALLPQSVRLKVDTALARGIIYQPRSHFSVCPRELKQMSATIASWLQHHLSPQELTASALSLNAAAGIITLRSVRQKSPVAQELENYLRSLPGHALSYILYAADKFTTLATDPCPPADTLLLHSAFEQLEKSGDWDAFLRTI